MNFNNIEYLKHGTDRQKQAYLTLKENKVLLKLKDFDPALVGTIPLRIDIAKSDLDVICFFSNSKEFAETVKANFGTEKNFTTREIHENESPVIVANFFKDGFEIELFGQNIPTKQQLGYRHMLVEFKLLEKYGEQLRQEIIELKKKGYKTEPAFALALDIKGDPYKELLKFEKCINNL